MSFPEAERMEIGEDVIASFCHFVHFFRSPSTGKEWLEQNPGHTLLSLDDALRLARKKNALQYGDPVLRVAR